MAQASQTSGEICSFQQNLVLSFFPHAALMCGRSKAARPLKKVFFVIRYAPKRMSFQVFYKCLEQTFAFAVKIAVLGQILHFSSFVASDGGKL
jgi:hypothetical protein